MNHHFKRVAIHRNSQRPRECFICGKYFERSDALRRHEAIHDVNRPPPKTRKRACVTCIQSKTRCDSGRPSCSKCRKRGLACHYASDINSPQSQQIPASPITSNCAHQTTHLSAIDPGETLQIPISNYVFPNAFADLDISGPFFEGGLQTTFDWIFPDSVEETFPLMSEIPSQLLSSTGLSTQDVSKSSDIPAEDILNGQNKVPDHESPLEKLGKLQVDKNAHPEDQWPMEWSGTPLRLPNLPRLGPSEEPSYYPNHFCLPGLASEDVSSLQDLLRVPLERSPWPQILLTDFPSGPRLSYCIDLYFAHFAKNFPFIHQATFVPAKEPLLTIAMALIGACYSEFDGARAFTNALSELTRRLLVDMVEHDPRFARTEYYLITQILQSIHGFSSGSKRLYELAEKNRGSLVYNARCMRLFEGQSTPDVDGLSLEERWDSWVRAERTCRLAWAVYAFDTSAVHMRDDRPAISIYEMKLGLPASTEHWEAESAQAWAALHPWAHSPPRSCAFPSAIESLFQSPISTASNFTDDYHKTLILVTIIRMLWSNKEAICQPGTRFLPSYNGLLQTGHSLVAIAKLFSASPKQVSQLRGQYSEEISADRLYLGHVPHFFISEDITHYCHLIWRGGPRMFEAQRYIHSWVVRNPIQARQLMYSGAQILALGRLYPYNHPQEAYNVFHGGLVLWLIAVLYSSDLLLSQSPATIAGPRAECQLDWIGPHEAPEAAAVQKWIKSGEQSVVRMFGVPDVLSVRGHKQILEQIAGILKRMRVWGIAQCLLNAVLRIRDTLQDLHIIRVDSVR